MELDTSCNNRILVTIHHNFTDVAFSHKTKNLQKLPKNSAEKYCYYLDQFFHIKLATPFIYGASSMARSL